ncbi:hypothetical protein APHAL10511_003898 [Amanita phalloides]|nr:hypothetical protein APHAL10511_003898 [Amanita phalloides]
MGLAAVNALGTNKLAFKSKVVSRAHAEIWSRRGASSVRQTKKVDPTSSWKDGDILQLGVDYQGGAEDIYKSVKIRVEVGREWQAGANAFNTAALKNLKNLAAVVSPNVQAALPTVANGKVATRVSKLQIPDCCICLFSVTIRQAFFIAPCFHAFHFNASGLLSKPITPPFLARSAGLTQTWRKKWIVPN